MIRPMTAARRQADLDREERRLRKKALQAKERRQLRKVGLVRVAFDIDLDAIDALTASGWLAIDDPNDVETLGKALKALIEQFAIR